MNPAIRIHPRFIAGRGDAGNRPDVHSNPVGPCNATGASVRGTRLVDTVVAHPFHCFDIHIPNHSPLTTAAGIACASGVASAISTTR
nr:MULTISPECIES: hypothetical protein [Burkholderia]